MTQELTVATSASELNQAIEAEAVAVKLGELNLDRTYARLARLLATFKKIEGWRTLEFASMNRYMLSLVEKTGRSVQQLYSYSAVGEALLPVADEATLEKIGVSKGFELAKAAKKAGRPVTPELIAAALDEKNGINEIRAMAHQVYELPTGDYPKGTWFDLGGFYASAEFRKLYKETFECAVAVLGIPKEMPEWAQKQRVFEVLLQEFYGTHAAEAQEPQNG